MRPTLKVVLRWWHGKLALPRRDPPSWYADRLQEELVEFREATTSLEKLSEESDVFFAKRSRKHEERLAVL
jgi:hypothetical protein